MGVVLENKFAGEREDVLRGCRVAQHCNVQLRSWMTILALPSEKRGKGLTKIV